MIYYFNIVINYSLNYPSTKKNYYSLNCYFFGNNSLNYIYCYYY